MPSLSSLHARAFQAHALLLVVLLAALLSANARAQELPGLTPAELAQVFPDADRAGPVQGEPQAAPAPASHSIF